MAATEFTVIDADDIRTVFNRGAASIPAKRVVSLKANSGTALPGELSVDFPTTAAKAYGVTMQAIAVDKCGDVAVEGTVPVESDGTGAIAAGDLLTFDATTGRVKTAAPSAGANAHIVGQAETAAAATAGAVLMMRVARSVLQG